MNDDRFVVVDIETTGLTPMTDLVLEIGVVVYGAQDLNLIDCKDVQVWSTPVYDRAYENMLRSGENDFVLQMHQKSGLWDACRSIGVPIDEAEQEIVSFLEGMGPKGHDPMVGSTINFDRGFLLEHCPEIEAWFHYRSIDVSTIKELCRRLNPEVYAKLDSYTEKRETHRVLADIEDTVNELAFYRDNFLFTAPEVLV